MRSDLIVEKKGVMQAAESAETRRMDEEKASGFRQTGTGNQLVGTDWFCWQTWMVQSRRLELVENLVVMSGRMEETQLDDLVNASHAVLKEPNTELNTWGEGFLGRGQEKTVMQLTA